MAFEHYVQSGGKRFRCGFTTGTCAALAAAGAARLLLTGKAPETVSLVTPKGISVEVPLDPCAWTESRAVCAVQKDAGDDIDVTDGLLIFAAVEFSREPGIAIDGGEGVGRVTKPGLDQPVGAAAINHVPRQMIRAALEDVCGALCCQRGLRVTISVPGGAEIAAKTFNPNLGIVGGISILGTSGIVEPMSMQALIDTIALELRQHAAQGARHLILTPGNYGMDYLKAQGLAGKEPVVKCSNFIGDAVDEAAAQGYETVLLVGHVGKLVKLAGGIMNTHSRYGDCRTELFCAHAAVCGAGGDTCRALMDAATTDACLEILVRGGLRETVMDSLLEAVDRHLQHRVAGAYRVGAILFSNEYGYLGQTRETKEIIAAWT